MIKKICSIRQAHIEKAAKFTNHVRLNQIIEHGNSMFYLMPIVHLEVVKAASVMILSLRALGFDNKKVSIEVDNKVMRS